MTPHPIVAMLGCERTHEQRSAVGRDEQWTSPRQMTDCTYASLSATASNIPCESAVTCQSRWRDRGYTIPGSAHDLEPPSASARPLGPAPCGASCQDGVSGGESARTQDSAEDAHLATAARDDGAHLRHFIHGSLRSRSPVTYHETRRRGLEREYHQSTVATNGRSTYIHDADAVSLARRPSSVGSLATVHGTRRTTYRGAGTCSSPQ
ncbi:hypothetical protein C8Q80DRAFT_210159 [Daedaleopsis nitida]|nr:hypothetical protein C8Q80DRAFT_210159 [Daedaleopsis nitida]